MKPLGLLLCIALAHAAGAEPRPQFAASISIVESSPGAVSRAAKSGAVLFLIRVALPSDRIFPVSARPLSASVAFWPASNTGRRGSRPQPLGAEPHEVNVTVAIQGPGDYLASVVVLDRDGQPVAESTSTQFHF